MTKREKKKVIIHSFEFLNTKNVKIIIKNTKIIIKSVDIFQDIR